MGAWVTGSFTRPALWESLEPTAAILFVFAPPESIASSQNWMAVSVKGFGPGCVNSLSPAGPVAISIASTFE
jgi:hypothetical protein